MTAFGPIGPFGAAASDATLASNAAIAKTVFVSICSLSSLKLQPDPNKVHPAMRNCLRMPVVAAIARVS
jgi:hypothetical protein